MFGLSTGTDRLLNLLRTPNNPDGFVRQSVVNRSGGILVHDLSYYWPQYTPISSPADYNIMLFAASKSTGHAGMRIGWALVTDREIARRMTKFIELTTIGVLKDSQLRAAKVLKVVSDTCETPNATVSLFKFVFHLMAERWRLLKEAVNQSDFFSLPKFSPEFCSFLSQFFEPQPAFAWLNCDDGIQDCESFLRANKILTRSGKHFGFSPQYVRISMLDGEEIFNIFVKRLSTIRLQQSRKADE